MDGEGNTEDIKEDVVMKEEEEEGADMEENGR